VNDDVDVPVQAFLYRTALAKPVLPMDAVRWRTRQAMMRARRTCLDCLEIAGAAV
jgi:hypothetical protein